MSSHPLFTLYGLMLLGAASMADYSGWSLSRINEVKNVPKSVRDNPGVYRSVYGMSPHYSGGK